MLENSMSGYALLFYNALMPLNELGGFKKRFNAVYRRYMIDSPYWRNAVSIIIDHGTILVKGISKAEEYFFMEEKSRSHGYINMPMQLLLAFVNGQAGILTVAVCWLRGSVAMKGCLGLLGLLALFNFYVQSSGSPD